MAKIVLSVLLLAISSCSASYLVFRPATVNADLKKPVSLKCNSDEAMDIYFKDQKITQSAKYTVTRRAGIDLEVTISSVEVGDVGSYTCRSSASTPAAPVTVVLQLKPYFADNNEVFTKKLGTRAVVEFTILSQPRPDVRYQKKQSDGTYETIAELTDFGVMVIGRSSYGINKTNGHLTIFDVKSTDAGEYKVITTFRGVIREGRLTLNVAAKLAFKTRPLPSYDLVSGISATIPCVFAKIPAAVNWEIETEDNKRTVVTGTSKDFSVSQTGLTILSVSPDLEGATLKCIGRNELESASATTYIRMVYVMPAISVLRNESIFEGSEKTLKCVASGNPKPKVTWMKVNYDCTAMKLDQTQKPGESTLKIASASISDAGSYKCVAVISAKPNLKDEAFMRLNVLTDMIETLWKKSGKDSFSKCLRKKILMIRLAIPNELLPDCKIVQKSQFLQGRDANRQSAKGRDADQSFVDSILPTLKKLPAKKNRLAKIKILQMLFEYEFEDNK